MRPIEAQARRLVRGLRTYGAVRLVAKALRSAAFPKGTRRDKFWARRLRPVVLAALGSRRPESLPAPEIRTWTSPPGRLFGPRWEVKSVLVMKLDHIGDFLLALAPLAQLRRNFAGAEITLLCGSWNVQLARKSGLFDRVVGFDVFPAMADAPRSPRRDPRLIEKLGLGRFDLALDLRVDEDTRELLHHVSARCKAGYFSRLMPPDMAIVLPQTRLEPADGAGILPHQRSMMLRLVAAVIAYFDPQEDAYRVLEAVSAEHEAAAARMKVGWRAPVVAMHTASGREIKNWPPENFLAVCRWIVEDLRGTVVLLGGPAHKREAAELAGRLASPHVVDLVGRMPMEQSFAVVRRVDLFLGNDSGLTHAAAMLKVPTVALYSGMDPIAIWGPLGPHATAIRAAVPCSPCHLIHITDCAHGHACMRSIPVETVQAAMLRHLAPAAAEGDDSAPEPKAPQPRRRLQDAD